jgi:uncharacterized protein YneF (UPF0154 family)
MTLFENFSLVADLVFGLVMLVYGFAGGLFVAGRVLRKSHKQGGRIEPPSRQGRQA